MIRVVKLKRPGEFAKSVAVQHSAWGLGDAAAVPVHLLVAAQRHGGLVLGAFEGRRMVGVLFGFTALEGRRSYHYSHITGVARQFQSKGVGFRLKLAQRAHVIRSGQRLVKWTFDPLQAGNAFFNIAKLGAVCRTYTRDLYGKLNDSLNKGRMTDRFEVEWWVKSQRVQKRIAGKHKRRSLEELLSMGARPVNDTRKIRSGVRVPTSSRLGLKDRFLMVEIPQSIVRVRDESRLRARYWTLNVRAIFENYFEKGYATSDVVLGANGERRVFYLLEPWKSVSVGASF